jgi:probable selenium-dependent hydroxylase accessory protein YqeC
MKNLIKTLLPEDGGVISLVGAGGKTSLMFHLAHELARVDEPVLTTTTTKIFMPRKKQSAHVVISEDPDEILSRSVSLFKKTRHLTAAQSYLPDIDKLVGFAPHVIDRFRKQGPFSWILVEADGAAHRPLKAPAAHEPVIPKESACVIAVVGLDGVGKPLDEQWVFRSPLYSQITGLPVGSTVSENSIATIILDERGLFKGCRPGVKRCVFLNKAEGEKRVMSGERIGTILKKRGNERFDKIMIGSLWRDVFQTIHG